MIRTALIALTTGVLAACGATSKPLGSTSLAARPLSDKALEICNGLRQEGADPSRIDTARCADAGQSAVDLGTTKLNESLHYASNKAQEQGESLLKVSARAEFWLNTGIIGLIQKFTQVLERRNRVDNGLLSPHESNEGGSGAELVKTKFTVTSPLHFDSGRMGFEVEARIELSGAVTIDNTLHLAGKVFPGGIGVALDSRSDAPVDRSLLKRVHGFMLVIPHANDIYVDAFIETDVHSYGVDAVMDRLIRHALGSSLSSVAKLIPKFAE